jgi:hypothetical protein
MLSLSFNSSVSKAVRAYEVDRQRAKKAKDFELAKERKEQAAAEKLSKKDAITTGRRNVKDIWDRSEEGVAPARKIKVEDYQPTTRDKGDSGRVDKSGRKEMTLEDLIKPGGNRKGQGRSRKGKGTTCPLQMRLMFNTTTLDADFEVVPHVRAVIALDDEPDLFELDEPWEHVNADEDESHALSYAAVVSGA